MTVLLRWFKALKFDPTIFIIIFLLYYFMTNKIGKYIRMINAIVNLETSQLGL